MEINLKKHVDLQKISIEDLAQTTGVPEETLREMYKTGTFDENKLGVHGLLNLMIALDLSNIKDLIPTMK